MSDYDAYERDEPRRYKSTRTRPRERGDPEYIEETTYVERGKGRPPQDLVFRGRDRDESIEDIPRDFPPPRGGRGRHDDDYDDYDRGPRRARSVAGRGSRYDDYDDYDDYAGPAGAAAGYAAGRRGSRRDDRRSGYYSDDGSPPRRDRRKSGLQETLEGLGLGGIVGALTGKKDNDRARSVSRGPARSRYGDDDYDDRDRSRSRPKGERRERQWAQAAQAAIVAGAIEAFRVRKLSGEWKGAKGKRVATAAIGAGGIDKLIDRDPDNKTKRHLVEAVLGGLVANRLANGSIEKDGDGRGRSRSRSRSRGGLRSRSQSFIDRLRSKSRGRSASVDSNGSPRRKKSGNLGLLAGAGAVAVAGKAMYDRARSKSRGGKDRRREASEDSYEARGARGGRSRDVGSTRDGPNDDPDGGAVVGPRGRNRAVGPAAGAGAVALSHGDKERKRDSSSSSSESETDIEKKRKKLRGKEILTAGLATIATIHAAHGVYQSMEASEKRHTLVAEGEMSKEEARKKRSKAWLQDAAAVGIAALGIKGAYSEWKEMNHQRHTVRELEERKRKRHKKMEQRQREQMEAMRRVGGGRVPGRIANEPHRDSFDSGPPAANGYSGGGGGGYDPMPPPPLGHSDRY